MPVFLPDSWSSQHCKVEHCRNRIYSQVGVCFTDVKTRRQFDMPQKAAYLCWDAPSGLALSLEIALCLHAVSFVFFPGWTLTSHLFKDTSRANLKHLQQRSHLWRKYMQSIAMQMFWSARNSFFFCCHAHKLRGTPPPSHQPPLVACCLGAGVKGNTELFTLLHYLHFQIVPGINCYRSPGLISINFSNSLI